MNHSTFRSTRAVICVGFALMALALMASAGCKSPGPDAQSTTSSGPPTDARPVIDPGDGGDYRPELDTTDSSATIDNPYLPMPVGAKWRYEGESDGATEVIEIEVTDETRSVMGIDATVVRDTVTIDGELVEDTFDWFAQDARGNVWYLGEDVKDYDNGKVVGTAGSWEAGVDGALPGIVMPAQPTTGDVFRQEYLAGEAEDMMEITGIDQSLTVASGTYDKVVQTRDWTPLEPDTIEEKAYAYGVGMVREHKVAGGDGYAELVDFDLGR